MSQPIGTDKFGSLLAVAEAQQRLLKIALETVVALDYADDGDPNADASAQYHSEQLALAARDLAEAVDALPAGERRPIGWNREGARQ